jgi:hypothetical protein
MKTSKLVLTVGVLLVGVPALAGPLAKKQVSGGANWVFHVDIEQFRITQMHQFARPELENLGIEKKLQDFATLFSFHPIDDLRDVTIYGKGQDRKKAVVLIEGTFDKERLLALLGMAPEHEEIQYGDIVLHKWIDEKKKDCDGAGQTTYCCFYGNDLIVMGTGLDGVKHAVDVLDGTTVDAASVVFNPAIENAKGAFLQVMATNIRETIADHPKAAVLRQAEQFALAAGEAQGKFYIDWRLTAKSEEVAQAINKILDGIIAFAMLAGEDDPKLAELAAMVDLSCQQNIVRVCFESDPARVVKFLAERCECPDKIVEEILTP